MEDRHVQRAVIALAFSICLIGGFEAHAANNGDEDPKLEKLSAKKLEQLETRANEARSLYSMGDYAGAEPIFRELAKPFTVTRPLYRCELAMCLLSQGKNDEARVLLLESYGDLLEFFDPKSEKKAVRIWGKESGKIYKGDPYEQATLCLLLGALFLEQGDVDNALACFKSGQLADSDVQNEEYKADYALLQLLESYCYHLREQPDMCNQLAQTGVDSFMSIAGEAQSDAYIAPLTQPFNTLLLIMSGEAPHMIRQGEYGEQRVIVLEAQPTNRYEILLDGERWFDAIQGVGDINFQAATRGGRQMDDVLSKQAKTKKTTYEIGDTFTDDVGGLAGLFIGSIIKGVSAAMTVEADVRCWQTLPGSIQPVPLNLPPGEHKFDIYAFDGYVYSHHTPTNTDIRPGELNIVFVFPKNL